MGEPATEPSGQHVAELRLAHGLSARQLAELAGISTSSVSRAERGGAVTRDVLAALARVLGPSVFDVLSVWPPLPDGTNAVAEARRATGESRREAADRAGVSDDVLSRAERGIRVHPANAKRIGDAFGLTVAQVLTPPNGADNRAAA